MEGLHPVDYGIVSLYLVGITLLGFYMKRRVRDIGDYVMPRRFGKWMMVMHSFGTGTSTDQAVAVASKSFTNGLSGIWYQWLWLFATPFYWLIAPVMRRSRALTTADIFEARFSKSVAMLFAIVGSVSLMVSIGLILKGSGEMIAASTGGFLSADLAIGAMTILFVIYGMAGGLSAAIVTDFVQGILTIIFSFLLLPFILKAVGGLQGLHQSIADPQMFSLVAPAGIGTFYIAMIAINGLVGIVTQAVTMGNCAAGKTEMEGRVGFMGGSLIKRVCTIPWCLTGFAAMVYFAGQDIEGDQVYGLVAGQFLPQILPGLLGLFLVALLAAVTSTCDSSMIAAAGLFTENFYKYLVPAQSPSHYVFVARISSLVVVAGGVVFSYWLEGVVQGLEIFWQISPMIGIAFWLGLFWRGATVAGAWASTLAGFGAWLLTTFDFFVDFAGHLPLAGPLRFVFAESIYLPWQMLFYLIAGTAAGIIVSLLTEPVSKEKLDHFFALLRTSIAPDEEILQPCTLPRDAVVPPVQNLLSKGGLEIPVPSRTAVTGFLVGWACVAAIIYAFKLLTKG